MRRVILVIVSALLFVGIAQAYSWQVVASKSASGEFASTATSKRIIHPKALAVRYFGSSAQGFAAVACSRGFTVTSNTKEANGPGLYRLRIMRNADDCSVTASVAGEGYVKVQILKAR